MDSNHRRHKPTRLQRVPFSHSGTRPESGPDREHSSRRRIGPVLWWRGHAVSRRWSANHLIPAWEPLTTFTGTAEMGDAETAGTTSAAAGPSFGSIVTQSTSKELPLAGSGR